MFPFTPIWHSRLLLPSILDGNRGTNTQQSRSSLTLSRPLLMDYKREGGCKGRKSKSHSHSQRRKSKKRRRKRRRRVAHVENACWWCSDGVYCFACYCSSPLTMLWQTTSMLTDNQPYSDGTPPGTAAEAERNQQPAVVHNPSEIRMGKPPCRRNPSPPQKKKKPNTNQNKK